ncbi:Lrp/AsnC family transcriptional regulator, partial [Aduncisulcus paluster]
MGSHDVAAYFLAADRQDLGRLIDAVSAVDGVADVEVTLGSDAGLTAHGARLFMAVDVPEIRLSVPRTGVDGLDIAILQTLVEDGRQSSRNIGRLLEVSEGTVRARISRMTQSGLLRIAAMVEP